MFISEGSSARFPDFQKANRQAALRFRINGTLSKPILDFFAIIFLPVVQIFSDAPSQHPLDNLAFWALAAALSIMLIYTHGGYDRTLKSNSLKQGSVAILDFLAASFFMLSASCLSLHEQIAPNPWAVGDVGLAPVFLMTVRYVLLTRIKPLRPSNEPADPLLVCRGACPVDLIDVLPTSRVLRLDHIEDERSAANAAVNYHSVLEHILNQGVEDIILINQPRLENLDISISDRYFHALLIQPVRIWLAVNTALDFNSEFVANSDKYKLIPIGPTGLVSSRTFSKRFFDVVLASVLLFLSIPVLLIVACLVRASGPGPIVFRQKRIGAQGRDFTLFKFRTMKNSPGSPFLQARLHDERTTSIGRFLRRSSLDELLQLVNVLRGEMSLVGPRPHAPETQVNGVYFNAALTVYPLRHRVRPGITGLAQIRGLRGATDNIDKLRRRTESDLEYIQTWSLWLDIKIIIKSIAVFFRHDAY